jgi:hypothetical protein
MSFFSFFIGESSLIKKYYHQTGKIANSYFNCCSDFAGGESPAKIASLLRAKMNRNKLKRLRCRNNKQDDFYTVSKFLKIKSTIIGAANSFLIKIKTFLFYFILFH